MNSQRHCTYVIIQPGATLFEMIIAISLCTLAICLVIGLGTFFNRAAVRTSLDELYTTCAYVRMKALTQGTHETIVCNTAQNTYSWQGLTVALPNNVCFGTTQHAQGPPSSPTHAITYPVTFKDATIACAPTGIIRSGTVYLTDTARLYGYALTASIATHSYLRRYRYHDNEWQRID